jgi:hypothetical protein
MGPSKGGDCIVKMMQSLGDTICCYIIRLGETSQARTRSWIGINMIDHDCVALYRVVTSSELNWDDQIEEVLTSF